VRAPEVKHPAVTDEQQDEDAPYQVMNVMAAHHHPLKGSFVVDDEADQDADADERDQERDRCNERAAARPVGDGAADEEPEARQLKEHQKYDYDQAGKGEEQKGSRSGHR
jgi:hypothetical protein